MSVRLRPKYTKGMNDIRRLLDKIGESDLNESSKDWMLWSLLSALRGPDDDNDTLKTQTTARLRAKVYPNLARSARASRDPGQLHQMRPDTPRFQHHFIAHYNLAIQALEKLDIIQKEGV